jgi:hypothetical protein
MPAPSKRKSSADAFINAEGSKRIRSAESKEEVEAKPSPMRDVWDSGRDAIVGSVSSPIKMIPNTALGY